MNKPPFKLGISIGQFDGNHNSRDNIFRTSEERGEFEADISHPCFAVDRANRYIHETYGDNYNLIFSDGKMRRKRNRRR